MLGKIPDTWNKNMTKEQMAWNSTQLVREYANQAHADTNQMYAKIYPYALHLNWVSNTVRRFNIYLEENELLEAYCTAPLHDVIEDGRYTYNNVIDLLKEAKIVDANLRERVAENVIALTVDIRGRTRAERQTEEYYANCNKTKVRRFIKAADRFANMEYGSILGGSMLEKYRKENAGENGFLAKLNVKEFTLMYEKFLTF